MNSWLAPIVDFLANNSVAVIIAAAFIVAVSVHRYWQWFRPAALDTQAALERLAAALQDSPAHEWHRTAQQARDACGSQSAVKQAWAETEERVFALEQGERRLHVMLSSPRDIWQADRLLGRSINVQLAEAAPNLLVGVGLLFTFFFLTLALTQATAALLPAPGSAAGADLTGATRGLLSAAGAKFLTSLTGLFASICWTIAQRNRMSRLQAAADAVVNTLAQRVPVGGTEMALFSQLSFGRATETNTRQTVELAEELLEESREQTGTFKRFETDLAVTLANAITKSFSPQMERMTEQLVGAVNGLAGRLGAMNEDALKKMMEEFSILIRDGMKADMENFKKTLAELAEVLSASGKSIGEAPKEIVETLQNLNTALQTLKETMNDLDLTLDNAANVARSGAETFDKSLSTADDFIARLRQSTQGIETAAGALERTSGTLDEVAGSVEELAREQREVVGAVRDATPQALQSIQQVIALLERTVSETATLMVQARDAMTTTARTLATTVSEVTTGVTEYSGEVAELHRKMDEALARAVGSLDKGVTGLEEAIEELGEVLSSRLPRG
ncbi:hypothetical protein [Piscinibacterium candidicorallinum]|uniref:Methyl-accepting chemotaxis protein n=1 Tax=Piscinibacterium candidicorallinum TaxID=1793872 RepID=A0ABV7GZZ5_9BURK